MDYKGSVIEVGVGDFPVRVSLQNECASDVCSPGMALYNDHPHPVWVESSTTSAYGGGITEPQLGGLPFQNLIQVVGSSRSLQHNCMSVSEFLF